jgi:uncharacterized protein (DUF2236 family)
VTVEREDLERAIEELRREVRDPCAGIFGPDSMSWRIDREMVLFLAGGRAALLQLAHPFVAYAIEQHSNTRHDPLGRFQRTFEQVFAMGFGDLEHAIAAARRVHAVHRRIRGYIDERVGHFEARTEYLANDEDALMWVHATLVESAVKAYELVVEPLSPDERERYYAESRRFARLFGIPERVIPSGWEAFMRYNEDMWRRLAVATPAREMARFLLSSPALRPPALATWYRTMTAGLMPEPLRAPFGLHFGARERVVYRASIQALRGIHRALPERARWVPAYADARRRLEGKPGRDRLGVWMERYLLHAAIGGRPAQ